MTLAKAKHITSRLIFIKYLANKRFYGFYKCMKQKIPLAHSIATCLCASFLFNLPIHLHICTRIISEQLAQICSNMPKSGRVLPREHQFDPALTPRRSAALILLRSPD